ncbi:PTS transporter subunit EIIC [Providencia huaxiensis]|uniref:PTS transporter subunit EIIC n=1 Tax=Providencia huaxiensis TaxID=2027290 RepID=UPI0034E52F6B
MDLDKISKKIIELSGGSENFIHVTNCMTRVRMTLKDEEKADVASLKALPGVLGVVSDETLQVIVGPGKCNNIADAINQLLANNEIEGSGLTDKQPESDVLAKAEIARNKAKKKTPVKAVLRSIANIFVPLLPGLIAAGTLMGINNIIVNSAHAEALTQGIQATANMSAAQVILQQKGLLEISTIMGVIANGLFSLLAVFTGIFAAKEFKGTEILGGILGAITIAPQVAILGLTPGQGGLIGVIFAVWVSCWLEKRLRRYIPSMIDVIATPTLTIIIMAAFLLFGIMPVAGVVSNGILGSLSGILEHGGLAAGFILSSLFPFLISLGLHQGLIPIHLELIQATGSSQLFAIQIMSNSGMVGAAIAVLLLTKDPVMKRVAKGAIPTSILAVGEPTIFGVNIPAGFAFITGSIGAGFGGMMIVLLDVTANGVGAAGLSALPLIADGKYLQYIFSWLVGASIAFILTYFVGRIRKYQ